MQSYIRTQKDLDQFVVQVLNIGQAMYYAGSEISRIEDSLRRLGKAYGAEHVNIYAITSSIVATLEFPGYPATTQSRRMTKSSTDLDKLEKLNAICRKYVEAPDTVENLRDEVAAVVSEQLPERRVLAGEIIAASMFTIFFGGNVADCIAAGIFAFLIYIMQKYVRPICQGQVFFNFLVSLVTGAVVSLSARVFPILHADMIMIGDIMILIPGVAITNSIRYTISGDSISGFEKLIDAVRQALGIAAGFALAMYLFM